jgi:gluconokinase
MQQRGCVIGADLGTTSIKAVAFDGDGRELARAAETVALAPVAEEGAAEQEPSDVYEALVRVLAQVAGRARALGFFVDRVGLSAAMHSLVPVAADGAPLARALLWMDSRAQAEATALWASPAGKDVYQRTGTPVHPMSPLVKLIWLRARRPDLFRAAARFVSLKEWVWHRWFGEWQVDVAIASATGLYNLRERTWDRGALALAGLGPDRLSAIVPTTYVRQGVREPRLAQAGMSSATAFVSGASDGVLANLGAGAIGTDRMSLTIGTSLAVRTGSATPYTDVSTRSFCYVLDVDRFIVGGPSNSGGVVLEWLYRNILAGQAPNADAGQPVDGLAALIAAAEHASDDALLCLPYVAGERAPLWNGQASGVFLGLRLPHTAAHLMRAAIEGIIFNAHFIAARLIEGLGRPERIVASGKVLESAWVRQLTADVFGLPVQHLGNVDASVLGAATLANIAAGAWTWEDATRRHTSAEGTTTFPASGGGYERKIERYRRLYAVMTTELADVYFRG